jgi:hypothetical protein
VLLSLRSPEQRTEATGSAGAAGTRICTTNESISLEKGTQNLDPSGYGWNGDTAGERKAGIPIRGANAWPAPLKKTLSFFLLVLHTSFGLHWLV